MNTAYYYYSAPQCSHCKRRILATAIPSVCLSVLGFIHVYSHASILHVIFPFIKLLNIMLFYSVI